MTVRSLTAEERTVLAEIVLDPDAWWNHANTATNILDPESALAAKVARHKPTYDAAKARDGRNYKTRAQREAK